MRDLTKIETLRLNTLKEELLVAQDSAKREGALTRLLDNDDFKLVIDYMTTIREEELFNRLTSQVVHQDTKDSVNETLDAIRYIRSCIGYTDRLNHIDTYVEGSIIGHSQNAEDEVITLTKLIEELT